MSHATFARLLAQLARPYEPVATLEALGVPHRAARHAASSLLATSEEAERLLDTMPRTIRSLAIATTDTPIRCYGELRGPVMWSETVSSRAASAGDPGLFVCASPVRAFDTDENRVLTAALSAVRSAAATAEHGSDHHDVVVRRARHNGQRALRYLEHRSLADLPRRKPSGRALRRTRAGSRRATYQPALALLGRAADPLRPSDLAALVTADVATELALVLDVLDAAAGAGRPLPALRARRGGLEAGRLRLVPVARHDGSGAGLWIGDQRVASVDEALAVLAA